MTDQPDSPLDLFHELSGAKAHAALSTKRRWTHEAMGRVLFFPRTGITMVPYEMHRDGSWSCVVVNSGSLPSNRRSYPVGGYHLSVSQGEIETAYEVYLESALHMTRMSIVVSRLVRTLSRPRKEQQS